MPPTRRASVLGTAASFRPLRDAAHEQRCVGGEWEDGGVTLTEFLLEDYREEWKP